MNGRLFEKCGEELAEFMFSDLDLGIISSESMEHAEIQTLEIMIVDRLEMIIEINNLLYSN